MIYDSPEIAFIAATEALMAERKMYGFCYHNKLTPYHDFIFEDEVVNEAWHPKVAWKGNKPLPWGRFLTEAVFPEFLYWDNDCNLLALLEDERFYDAPHATKKSTFHSHSGRMARYRDVFKDTKYKGYLHYMLDRWKRENHKSYPHFHFNVESSEWMFYELFKNPNQIKTGRTATSCTATFSFRWDSKTKTPYLVQYLKHSQWSHIYGDFCGAAALLRAVCRELGYPCASGVVVVMAVSVTMDAPTKAKNILKKVKA